jgi:hypothetical protein
MAVNKIVQTLSDSETRDVVCDARIVAMRWDIVPWSLVLDLDAPVSEAAGAEYRRAWVVYKGLAALSFDALEARLPTGIWVTSAMAVDALTADQGFLRATFHTGAIEGRPSGVNRTKKVVIACRQIVGLASIGTSPRDEFGLSWQARIGLATDEQMRECLSVK